jgi:hypothetical protein
MDIISTGKINHCMAGQISRIKNDLQQTNHYQLAVFLQCPANQGLTCYVPELTRSFDTQLEAKIYLRELRRQWKQKK